MLKRLALISLLFLLCIESLVGQNRLIQKIDESTITTEQIDKVITRLIDTANVTGLGLAVFNNDKVMYQEAFGLRRADTKDQLQINDIFYGASFSKAVFAVLVMQLVEEGIIDLDTPIQSYLKKNLPDYKFTRSWKGYHDLKDDKRYELITPRMCLTHSTGFPNWRFLTTGGYDRDGKLYFQFNPGERYSYSGEGLSLLQFVLEQLTGQGLEEMAQQRIFKPLDMDRTSYIYVMQERFKNQYVYGHDSKQKVVPFDQADEPGAAGSLGTTLVDYSKFLSALLDQRLLERETYNEMFKPQIHIHSKQQFGPNAEVRTQENKDINLSYGLGWGVFDTPFGKGVFKEGHSEGYQHYSILFPETNSGIVIMTNSNNGESIFKDLLEEVIGDSFTPWYWENYIPYNYQMSAQNN